MKPRSTRSSKYRGFMLLEALVAILIFALGVLGIVGLQANAIAQSSQAKYRADATLLINDLIGRMWVSDRSFTALNTAFSSASAGALYAEFKARVEAALPGAQSYPPSITLTQINPLPALIGAGASAVATGLTPSTRVTVTLRWKAPAEPSGDPPHNLVVVSEIK